MGIDMKDKDLKSYFSKNQWYVYYRPTHARIRAQWGTPAFDAERADLESRHRKQTASHLPRKSFFSAIHNFEYSEDFRALPLRTRSGYIAVIKWLPPKDATIELTGITAAFVRRLRDKASRSRGPRFGNAVLSFIQAAIAFFVANGTLATNRVANVPKLVITRTRTTQRRSLSSRRTRLTRPTNPTSAQNCDGNCIGDFTRK